MNKAIHIENTNKNIARVLSIVEPEIIDNNPTELEYILIDDFTEAKQLDLVELDKDISDMENKAAELRKQHGFNF